MMTYIIGMAYRDLYFQRYAVKSCGGATGTIATVVIDNSTNIITATTASSSITTTIVTTSCVHRCNIVHKRCMIFNMD